MVDDIDLREALFRGIGETGVPTIESEWVPASKQAEIEPTFTKIAKPDNWNACSIRRPRRRTDPQAQVHPSPEKPARRR